MRMLCHAYRHTGGFQTLRLASPHRLRSLGRWGLLAVVLLGLLCWSRTATSASSDPHTIVQRMGHAYDNIHDYTALFLKRERINGSLMPLEKIELRFQEPFKVYMAWHEPYKGRVVTYVEGENNNKIHVNPGGMLRFMRLSLDPSSPLATRNSHYTILQIGLRNTIDLLMQQYQRGIQTGQMSLHFRGHGNVGGRPTYHLEFICHGDKTAGCYGARGEIWVDKDHYLPIKVRIYNGDNQLYEHYEYHRLQLNPGLAQEAFHLAPAVKLPPPTATAEELGSP